MADSANYLEKAAAEVYRAYEEELAQSNAVDFDDLLVKARRMLAIGAGFVGTLVILRPGFQTIEAGSVGAREYSPPVRPPSWSTRSMSRA